LGLIIGKMQLLKRDINTYGRYFDIWYSDNFPDYESFVRWFMGSEGPATKILFEEITPNEDNSARITSWRSGQEKVNTLHAELLKLYPQTSNI
jgi:hypothetical protein